MPVIDDIEALKNAEQALRESEIRMRALLDASQDEILLVSTDGTVLAINKAARARLAKRIADSDPIGARLDQLLPKDLAKSRLAVVERVAALPRWPCTRARSPSGSKLKRTCAISIRPSSRAPCL